MNTHLALALAFLSSTSTFAATPSKVQMEKPGRSTTAMPNLLERARVLPPQTSQTKLTPAAKKTSRSPKLKLKGATVRADPDSENEESCLETL